MSGILPSETGGAHAMAGSLRAVVLVADVRMLMSLRAVIIARRRRLGDYFAYFAYFGERIWGKLHRTFIIH
jgi:hypothetical protein